MLWLAVRNTDFMSIRSSLVSADTKWAFPFLGALFLFYWLKATRWKDLLATKVQVHSGDLFPSVMIGYAGTAILPMQMGELVRAYIVGKKYSLPFALVLSSIGMERIFDLLTILVLLGVVLATGQSSPELLVKAGYVIGVVAILGLVFAIWLAANSDTAIRLARFVTRWMPQNISEAIIGQLLQMSRGFDSIKRPELVVRIAINSILQWSLMGLCVWFSLLALDLHVPASGVILVLVATIVGISLPTSPGYVGSIQLAFVFALRPFGISASQAVAASVFYHVLAYAAVVVVGFSFLYAQGHGLLDLERRARLSSRDQSKDANVIK